MGRRSSIDTGSGIRWPAAMRPGQTKSSGMRVSCELNSGPQSGGSGSIRR